MEGTDICYSRHRRGDIYPFKNQKDSKKGNNYYVKSYIGFGILDVDMTDNGKTLTGKFYADNNNGRIIDQFTIIKYK